VIGRKGLIGAMGHGADPIKSEENFLFAL